MLSNGSLKIRLWKFHHVLHVLMNDAQLMTAFANYGIGYNRLMQFQALLQRCHASFSETHDIRSSGLDVTDTVQAELDQVKHIYQRHLKMARHVMVTRGDQARLELSGPRVDQTWGWLYQARFFYRNMGAAQLALMARFQVNQQEVDQMIQRLNALEAHFSNVHVSRVQMVRKTRQRDAAFAEMARAATDLELVMDLLNDEFPDLMAILLRDSRTRSGNVEPPPLEDPEPTPEDDPLPESESLAASQPDLGSDLESGPARVGLVAALTGDTELGDQTPSQSLEAGFGSLVSNQAAEQAAVSGDSALNSQSKPTHGKRKQRNR